ncbi:CBS [Pseudooceanicola batsensis HTCC2597]|uniref:CBS n=1 Tax=Pseudooceanicola batsensis (strain ATCC BAA-863 / DSM 15984 / KCTC 12145 / HTCC2597) TaxID=252305 RepID=A3TV06_PSEBH|nr:CBS domain-containing protein [Pseudooceanicola batsensis]EAQ04352.1 CBS [Pseudooceanicola batsensis HTCC2597]
MIIQSISEIIRNRTLRHATPDMTVRDACRILDEHAIGALPVLDGGKLLGILSERDVIRRVIVRDRDPSATKVSEVMTPEPLTISAQGTLATAMGKMLDGGFRHLPVTRANEVVGMLSMRDIPPEYRLVAERYRDQAEREAEV